MPGLYTEPVSRAAPTNDPACAQYKIKNDRGETGAVSYAYQWHCPNDQNLIAVLGREPGPNPPPDPPLTDRHGIPDLGPCVRCNIQMEGSGVSPDDVTIDAGDVTSGDHAPIGPATASPGCTRARAPTPATRATRKSTPNSATARRSASATPTTTRAATRAPTATRRTSTTTTSTTARSGSRRTCSRPRATPASRRT